MNINPANEVAILPPPVNGLIGHPTGLRTDTMAAKNVGDNVLASMIDIVVVADMDLTITYANDAALTLSGYCRHELVGESVNTLMADGPVGEIELDLLNETGSATNLNKLCLTKNGDQTPVSFSLSFLKDDCGDRSGIVFAGRDVTGHTRAEAERKVISEIIRGVTTTSNLDELLALIHASIGNLLYAENCYVALCDAKTELLSMQFFVDKVDPPPATAKLGKGLTAYVYRTGTPMLMTAEVIHELTAAGEVELVGTVPGVWLGVPLKTPEGVIGVLVVQNYDDPAAYDQQDLEFLSSVAAQIAFVIERKRTEETMRENEAKFRDLFDNAPVAYHELDKEGRFTRINHTEELLLGYTSDELKGRQPCEIIVEQVSRDATKAKLNNDAPLEPVERTFIRKDGTTVSVLNEDRRIRDAHGNTTGMRSTLQNITALKEAEEKMKAFNEKLQHSNRELQDFAYVASHDLQEPLRKVQAFSDRLKTKFADKLEDEGLDYLERMRSAANRMQLLIQDLLMFSRVSTQAQPFVSVDLNKITTEVLSDLEVKIEETGATVEIGDLPVLDADPMQMRQLIQNLVGNALKFRQADTAPIISLSSKPLKVSNGFGKCCEITVKDNGIGFDEKYTDKIFAVFQRLHGRTEYEGSGVGLSICRKIVERHNGNIKAKSQPGEGATFILTLPLKQQNPEVNS